MTVRTALRKPLLLALALAATQAQAAAPLPALGADISRSSVSGLSSGAFMAAQLHLALSDIMQGAGIVAGGPYLCTLSWPLATPLQNALGTCMNPLNAAVGPNVPHLLELTRKLADQQRIPPLANLADDRVYLFSGQQDATVRPLVVRRAADYYRALGVPADRIELQDHVPAGHGFITATEGDVACGETAAPFINNCGFQQAERILQRLYPDLQPAAGAANGELLAFEQAAFIDSPASSMDDTAYAYVPASCRAGGCAVHVVLHGCSQGAEVLGDRYYRSTGYNRLADSNGLIMLYPQVHPSASNPRGCWDWWGYSATDGDFYSSQAPQIRAIRRMLEHLAAQP